MNNRKTRVLFLLQRPEAWINLASIHAAMLGRQEFEPVVWALPYNVETPAVSARKAPLIRQSLRSAGVAFHEWTAADRLEDGHFDVAILNHPYDRERPKSLWFDRIAAVVPVTIYIPYGIVMGGGKKNLRLQFAQPTQMGATATVARSMIEKQLYADYCPAGDSHVHVLGHPRFDHLLESLSAPVPPTLARAIGGRLAVLWNSHFSFGRLYSQSTNFSTFDVVGPELFELALARRGRLCLLWRPHPGLFPAVVREGLLDDADLPALRSELSEAGVVLDETADHAAAFNASDAMLSDVGSFLLEYLATGKPILSLLNPDGEPLNPESSRLVSHYAHAGTPAEVVRFIDALEAGEARITELQDAQMEHLPMLDGHAGARVAQLILDIHRNGPTASERRYSIDPAGGVPSAARMENVMAAANMQSAIDIPPTLERLIHGLRALRDAKASERGWKREARRYANHMRTTISEAIKQHPLLMHGARVLRGPRGR